MSLGPPAGNGTISRIGLVGNPARLPRPATAIALVRRASCARCSSKPPWSARTFFLASWHPAPQGLHRTSVVSLRGQVCRLPRYNSRGRHPRNEFTEVSATSHAPAEFDAIRLTTACSANARSECIMFKQIAASSFSRLQSGAGALATTQSLAAGGRWTRRGIRCFAGVGLSEDHSAKIRRACCLYGFARQGPDQGDVRRLGP